MDINPGTLLTLSVYHWSKLYSVAEDVLHHAALRKDDYTVEAMSKVMSRLDDIMYGGVTHYDNPDQLELDFGDEEERP